MKYLKVKLWNREIGRLVWDAAKRLTYFTFNEKNYSDTPDIAPLLSPISRRNPLVSIFGDNRDIYKGLPPFIADSLPDSWGNTLFDKWVSDKKMPRSQITPLHKLMFIGKRGMGALEYEPADDNLNHIREIDIQNLYELSLQILEQRDAAVITPDQALTKQALLAVGTSAGGRQMKAIIAINSATGQIRSGQTAGLEGYEYYILKFGDKSMPTAEIEMTYYEMAQAAGIKMEESRLMPVEGINHFLTKRFDRKNGRKVLTQTLAAICPEAHSYEDLIDVCRAMSLDESEISHVYRQMVFNVMANNTDDHHKNFSFLMDDNGRWHLSPAYDVTFIFNPYGTGPNLDHIFSIWGKTSEITRYDLLEFAQRNEIKNAGQIIDDVAAAISSYNHYARIHGITHPWADIIEKTLSNNLIAFGYQQPQTTNNVIAIDGHNVEALSIAINSKGYYDITVHIDGQRKRKVVRPKMPEYQTLAALSIYNLTTDQKAEIVRLLFEI